MAINFLNTIAVDENVLFVDTTNDRVGIGTASPGGELEVNGTIRVGNSSGGVWLRESGSKGEILGLKNAGTAYVDLSIRSASGTQLHLDTSGNVGIGTASPEVKLDVNGNIQSTNQTRAKGWYTSGSGLALETGVSGGNGYVLSYDRTAASYASTVIESTGVQFVTSSAGKFYFTGGNVGIGNTSPGAKLDIVGSSIGIRVKKADLSDVLRVYTQGSGIFMDNGNVHISDDLKIGSTLLSNQENTDIDSAASEVVAQVAHATYTAAFFDFVVKKGINVRSGTVYACHNGDSTPLVEFTETSTNDLGDTSDVTLSVDISGANMRLVATVASDDWSVKSLIRAI